MSEFNPYRADPYRPGGIGDQDFLSAQGYPLSGETEVSTDRAGYYSAGYSAGQPDPYLTPPGGQMVPYSAPPEQSYGQPYSQQYAYPPTSYGPYAPYGPGMYWGVPYDPRRYEANALGGWALGLGIASLLLSCYLGLVLGVPAIIVGVKGMRAADEGRAMNKTMSIIGVVLGSVGAAASAAYLLFFIAYLGMLQA